MFTYIRVDVALKGELCPDEDKVKSIVREVASRFPGWKFLDRCEPAMASEDETRQLRCLPNLEQGYCHRVINHYGAERYSLKFHQENSKVEINECELRAIAELLKEAFTYHLAYELDVFIISETTIA